MPRAPKSMLIGSDGVLRTTTSVSAAQSKTGDPVIVPVEFKPRKMFKGEDEDDFNLYLNGAVYAQSNKASAPMRVGPEKLTPEQKAVNATKRATERTASKAIKAVLDSAGMSPAELRAFLTEHGALSSE